MKSNIFITGFSGSGKTTVGREVARRLGWRFVDIDDEIVRLAGRAIDDIFSAIGEAHFRRLESECLDSVCTGERQVVSTGGGLVMGDLNRRLMADNGFVVCLEARPETIFERLEEQGEGASPVVRPVIVSPNPLDRIRSLKAERQPSYALADWTVHTDRLTAREAAQEVLDGWRAVRRGSMAEDEGGRDLAAVVRTSSGDYPVWVGWGIVNELGERAKRVVAPSTAYIVTDERVSRLARRAQRTLEWEGIRAHMFVMPPGERSKSLETAQHIYGWLADREAERSHLVLGVGGGVVGDLAGFVAATYLRGMPVAHLPTSLLAMMDAAIGGKVAVDLPRGKNLVGAFHQPRFVLTDVGMLETLPSRELVSGWAEAIKHGLILDEGLLSLFERHGDRIRALEPDAATDVIRRSVAIKARIVSEDERETLGVRILLNYGHTIGHAIEAATGYGRFLHGEAVSVGMMGAAYISHAMGLLSAQEVDRQRALLESFRLPLACPNTDTEAVASAMRSDKKTSSGAIRWVLLDGIGKAVTRNDVPFELVQETLGRLAG